MPRDFANLLTSCESEPIHLCGAIQPHGFLIAINRNSNTVEFVSANVSEFIQISATELLNKKVTDTQSLLGNCRLIASFSSGDLEVFEAEHPAINSPAEQLKLLESISQVSTSPDLPALFDTTAAVVRLLTGYDRVMVYQFAEDWTGTVVGESIKEDSYESFRNLRFPAEDIPKQARELYARNSVRYIPEVEFKSVVLQATAKTELDLSQSFLRAVSPVHLEYLRNMNVAASMSFSIIIEGKLWGLIACHNRVPRHVALPIRQACIMLTDLCAQFIQLRSIADSNAENSRLRALQLELIGAFSQSNDLRTAFQRSGDRLLNLVKSSSVLLIDEQNVDVCGASQDREGLEQLGEFLRKSDRQVKIVTDELHRSVPEIFANTLGAVNGLLAIKLAPHSWIAWLRPELISEIFWAGEPVKVEDADQSQLHPRRSFKLWKQTVKGKSIAWDATEVHSAEVLGDYMRQRIASERRFLMALEASSQSMLGVDPQGIVKFHNAAAAIFLGETPINAPESHAAILNGRPIAELLPDGLSSTHIIAGTGRAIPIRVALAPLNTAEGVYSLYSITDISEIVAAESERARLSLALQDSNQKMEQFVDTIAHDLRAPLLSIGNLAQWIKDDLKDQLNGIPGENMEQLLNRVTRMRDQLSSLLEYSKAGNTRAKIELVDSEQLAKGVAESIGATAQFKLHYSNLPKFDTVAAPLEHVFYNLIDNACKYSNVAGSTISVECVDAGEYFRFSVSDAGQGIPLEYQEEVFYPLRSLAGNDKQGHGMGLAFVKRIVEQSGGKVSVVSSPGEGASFSFLWRKKWNLN